MKIVLNKCYGGFSLSPKALKRFYELKGRSCFFFKQDGLKGKYKPTSINDTSMFLTSFDIPNPNELKYQSIDWDKLTSEQRVEKNRVFSEHYLSYYEIDRTDPNLVQVVEELGEKANGSCAELHIVEIPEGVEYEIDEYDGIESVHEKHRSWG